MQSNLNKIRNKVQGKENNITLADEQFLLAKELGCLSEIIGRDFEFIEKDGKVVGFRQLPMKIPIFLQLRDALEKYKNEEKKQMKKGKRGKR